MEGFIEFLELTLKIVTAIAVTVGFCLLAANGR